jgi:hypothetical protein
MPGEGRGLSSRQTQDLLAGGSGRRFGDAVSVGAKTGSNADCECGKLSPAQGGSR